MADLAAALALLLPHPASCPALRPGPRYVAGVTQALRSGRDVWGEALLRRPGGPTYDAAGRYLKPLVLARGPGKRALTRSGAYYLPFASPPGPYGSGRVQLHLADGSEIDRNRVGGAWLRVYVGAREPYGSCRSRLETPRLADGYLPILETSYRGASGVLYRQESFAAGSPPVSYVRLDGAGPVGVTSSDGASARVEHGPLYLAWPSRDLVVDRRTYDRARAALAASWRRRLAAGAEIVLPERRVVDAERALLIQNLMLGWRYSVGNAYQEFSFPESLEVAQVMGEYGFGDVERAILEKALRQPGGPYPNWRRGEKLLTAASIFRLARDRRFLELIRPVLTGYVDAVAAQLDGSSLLRRERYSSDIPDEVYGLHSQAVVWQALRAVAEVWSATGHSAVADRALRLAARLRRGIGDAVGRSERRLADGSLFMPVRLLDRERPYQALTESRRASYWNLVAPYAFASGLFPPRSAEAEGILRYLGRHGGRLLGLVRAGAFALYRDPAFPTSGTDEVYGNNAARFLADNDRAEELVLSLYGQLAAAMAPGTFVSGEGASVAPLPGEYYRAMYQPPNSASNAAFLEKLRLAVVHETARSLELAYATSRAWLRPGARIQVRSVPTRFGPVSFSLSGGANAVRVDVEMPPRPPAAVRLRLRLPGGRTRTVDLSGRRGHIRFTADVFG